MSGSPKVSLPTLMTLSYKALEAETQQPQPASEAVAAAHLSEGCTAATVTQS